MPKSTHNPLRNYRLYVALAILFVVCFLLYPDEGRFPYQYQKGSTWTYETLIAPFDYPLLKTESELLKEKEEKASDIIPYYAYHNDYASKIEAFNRQRAAADSTHDDYKIVTETVVEALRTIYTHGVVSSFEGEDLSDKVIFVLKGKRAVETPASDVFDVSNAKEYIKGCIASATTVTDLDTLVQSLHLDQYIVPNLVYDSKTTETFHREAVDYISPTSGMIYSGQLIVSKGEIITADIEQMLDSYKAEYVRDYGYSGPFAVLKAGQALMLLSFLGLLFVVLLLTCSDVFSNLNQYYYILLLFFLSFLAIVLFQHYNPTLLLCVPFTVFVLFLLSFFPPRNVLPIYAVFLIPLLFIANDGPLLFFMNLVAGAVILISSKAFNRGWLQFVNSLIVFAVLMLVFFAYKFISGGEVKLGYNYLVYILINALLVVACSPLSLLFEKMFGLVSRSRLMDLSDTNNPVLQMLARKAPGTFQHSLQVANLSESAAREIGGDTLLVRVGAMYHDIGKTENPQCFIENQAPGVNYHEGLSLKQSAALIIKHVDDGVALAKKYNLPDVIADFIKTHHAKSVTLYFYNKYCNEGGNPADIKDFTYDGEYPESKEEVVVMMADAVEAASRSLKDYSEKSISDLVEKIVDARLSGEQLCRADISIREINSVKDSFKRNLLRVYNTRIAYPDRK
jgi:putative nucleotidyltransferase with HDIG domain